MNNSNTLCFPHVYICVYPFHPHSSDPSVPIPIMGDDHTDTRNTILYSHSHYRLPATPESIHRHYPYRFQSRSQSRRKRHRPTTVMDPTVPASSPEHDHLIRTTLESRILPVIDTAEPSVFTQEEEAPESQMTSSTAAKATIAGIPSTTEPASIANAPPVRNVLKDLTHSPLHCRRPQLEAACPW